MTGLLEGKGVLVTAAAGTGLGFAAARCAGEAGARVVLSDLHEGRLQKAAARFAELLGSPPPTVVADVTDQDQVDAMWALAEDALGGVDVLVNNAGLGLQRFIVDMTDEEWERVLDVSLTSVFRCTRAALRSMIPRESGVIVNISSISGWRAQTEQAAYGAAKAGVMALTRVAAMEGAPHGIRVNCVVPSLALHPHLEKVAAPELLADLIEKEAFGRAADPLEVGNVILFLASDLSSYLTGECISVSSQHP
jgi:3-oxoacyl-[acyl-carrier protein] reductase